MITITITPSLPRKAYVYKKANYEAMKTESNIFVKDYVEKHQNCTNIDQMWYELKDHIHNIVDKHVPQTTVKHHHGYPWITSELRRLIRKRDRIYNKMKTRGKAELREHYKNLKHIVQKETRKAYWDYISNIIAPLEKSDNKKFFSFLKSMYMYIFIKKQLEYRHLNTKGQLHLTLSIKRIL